MRRRGPIRRRRPGARVGAEARLNVVIKNAIPVTFRLGYAYGFDDDLGESQFIYAFAIDFWL